MTSAAGGPEAGDVVACGAKAMIGEPGAAPMVGAALGGAPAEAGVGVPAGVGGALADSLGPALADEFGDGLPLAPTRVSPLTFAPERASATEYVSLHSPAVPGVMSMFAVPAKLVPYPISVRTDVPVESLTSRSSCSCDPFIDTGPVKRRFCEVSITNWADPSGSWTSDVLTARVEGFAEHPPDGL